MKNFLISLLLLLVTIFTNAQVTSTTVKAQIDTDITNKPSGGGAISKTNVGNNMKAIVDYVDQQAPIKTQGIISANATPTMLSYSQNNVSGTSGIVYLPSTTEVGLEIIVNASSNITVYSNLTQDLKIYTTNPTTNALGAIKLLSKQCVRFTSRGSGFWQIEFLNEQSKRFIIRMTNNSGSFSFTVLRNDLNCDFDISNPANGRIVITPNTSGLLSTTKTYLKPIIFDNSGGGTYIGQINSLFSTTSALHIDLIKYDGTQTSTPNFVNTFFDFEVFP